MALFSQVGDEKNVYIDCPGWEKLSPFQINIGCGLDACVYKVPDELSEEIKTRYDNLDTVAKISKINPSISRLNQSNEIILSKIFGQLDVGPRVFDTFQCNNYLAIIMEQMDMTLYDLLQKFYLDQESKIWIYNRIEEKVRYLHENIKYSHSDLHINNIMIKFSDINTLAIRDIYLIDFGLSRPLYDNKFTNDKLQKLSIDPSTVDSINIYFILKSKSIELEEEINKYGFYSPNFNLLFEKQNILEDLMRSDFVTDSRRLYQLKEVLQI